jgi:hypothetical protein
VYVVLRGELEGFDASGHPHRAGPMDCTYIPAGCPHGVRNCGLDDVVLIWVHDGIERNDAAVYYPDDHVFDQPPPIELVRFADLEADWSVPGATEAGTMHWSVNWVGGLSGSIDPNPNIAVRNSKIAIGMTVLEPGHRVPTAGLPISRLYLVIQGDVVAGATTLGELDALQLEPGESAVLRNAGLTTARLLWVDSAG